MSAGCMHADILRTYLGATNWCVHIDEECLVCGATRRIKMYYHNRFPDREPWLIPKEV